MERPVCKPDIEGIRGITSMQSGGNKGDCIDAVIVATDLLFKATNVGPKMRTGIKKVVVITNAKVPCDMSDDVCEMMQRGLAQGGIRLEIIGIGWQRNDEDDEFLTAMQRQLDDMSQESGGGCQPVNHVSEVQIVAKKITMGNSKFRGELELSPDVKIPCWVMGRVVEDKFPSLKKVSLISEQDPEDLAEGRGRRYGATAMERQYKSLTEEDQILRPESMVKGYKYGRDRVPFSTVDEAVLKFEAERCLQLICFAKRDQIPRHCFLEGTDWIVPPGKAGDPISEKDRRAAVALNALAHAMHEEDRVAIVRFVKRARGTPSLCAIYAVEVDKDVCDERFSTKDDDEDEDDEDEDEGRQRKPPPPAPYHLYLTYLPFAEDHRDVAFPPVPAKMEPEKHELNAMDRLIDAMHLDKASDELDRLNEGDASEEDDDNDSHSDCDQWRGKLDTEVDSISCWLDPSMSQLPNPVLQRFYSAVQQRALDPLDEPPSALAPGGYTAEGGWREHLREPQGLLCRARPTANKAMDDVRHAFMQQLEYNHDLGRKKKFSTVAGDAKDSAGGMNSLIDDTVQSSAKKHKGGGSGSDSSGTTLVGGGLTQRDADPEQAQIGMSNPIADFEKIWQTKPETASEQMQEIINQMVRQSVRGHLYPKAIKCLRQLRKAHKSDDDWEPLNDYLRKLSGKHGTAGKPNHDFWNEVAKAGVTLISDIECEDSDTTQVAADAFIATDSSQPRQQAAAPTAAAPADDEDLFDDLD
jgi:ATP-dependent DNA helicase 2 subunit 2